MSEKFGEFMTYADPTCFWEKEVYSQCQELEIQFWHSPKTKLILYTGCLFNQYGSFCPEKGQFMFLHWLIWNFAIPWFVCEDYHFITLDPIPGVSFENQKAMQKLASDINVVNVSWANLYMANYWTRGDIGNHIHLLFLSGLTLPLAMLISHILIKRFLTYFAREYNFL